MKDIMLKITGKTISVNPAPADAKYDTIEFVTRGQYSSRGGVRKIAYEETELSGMEGYKTFITISNDKLLMQRRGQHLDEATIMEFEKGKRYEGTYATPYGNVAMEILTNKIDMEDPNKISIDYSLSFDGLMESRNTLDIEVIQ